MRAVIISLTAGLLITCSCSAESAIGRGDAFIGYSERALECEDRLDHCREKARHDGCLKDPYNMRTFCPITCAVSKCLASGTYRVRHKGSATPDGSKMFAERWVSHARRSDINLKRHFRQFDFPGSGQLQLSSLGVGTYLGDEDARTDDTVAAAVIYSVTHGWNVIDTASNYRGGRAERSVGAALDSLLAGRATGDFLQEAPYLTDVTRDMLFVSTKAGFVDPERLARANLSPQAHDAAGAHLLEPAYIRASVNVSLERLNLETVDLVYLHNAAEMQLRTLGRQAFREKLKEAFQALESLRAAGALRSYGLASWDCFRVPPSDLGHLSLQDVVALAREVAPPGKSSGFAAVQLPVSASMPEAWSQPWQVVGNTSLPLVQAAERLGVAVFTSGPLGEGDLPRRLTSRLDPVAELRGQATTPQKLLQLARSTPGRTVLTALVGHKTREYVEDNTRLALQEPLSEIKFRTAMAQVRTILDGPRGTRAGESV